MKKQLTSSPNGFSERFHIFAHGEAFDVDAFLAKSTFDPVYVWRPQGDRKSYGLELLLGDGLTTPLREQESIALAYLKTHRNELRALGKFPGLEAFVLGFVYPQPEWATGFCLSPLPQVMNCAVDIGIDVSYYGTIVPGPPFSEIRNKYFKHNE